MFSEGARRAVITGMGIVSPYGIGRAAFQQGLLSGRSATRRVTLFDPMDAACQVVAEVPDFKPEDHLARHEWPRVSRLVPLLRLAAREALTQAGLEPDRLTSAERENTDVILGSAGGGIEFAERQYARFFAGQVRRASPYGIASSIVGMAASELCLDLGLHGRSHVISDGCTSAADAMGYALESIRSGRARRVVTGGADACITPGILAGYCRMGVVPTHWNDRPEEASRPFASDRDGFVLGEGAWIFLLEEESEARSRGVQILAWLSGWGSTCDALHRVAPRGERDQAARALRLALEDSGLTSEQVEYVNLHGTGTLLGDEAEARALTVVFAERTPAIPMGATKSMIGHPQGASAAAGAAAVLVAMEAGRLPPTIHLDHPDPDIGLDLVAEGAREAKVGNAVVNCMGFGAKNTALVLRHSNGQNG